MSDLSWECLAFKQLTTPTLYALLQLRSEVFVVEQDCVYQDLDGYDEFAWHLLGWRDNTLLCYARLFAPGVKYPGASIGRVIIKQIVRGEGLGRELMGQAITACEARWPNAAITISAQHHLEEFYGSLGFETVSAPYLEDDIPHVEMHRSNQ